jgi:hypothetical protein
LQLSLSSAGSGQDGETVADEVGTEETSGEEKPTGTSADDASEGSPAHTNPAHLAGETYDAYRERVAEWNAAHTPEEALVPASEAEWANADHVALDPPLKGEGIDPEPPPATPTSAEDEEADLEEHLQELEEAEEDDDDEDEDDGDGEEETTTPSTDS